MEQNMKTSTKLKEFALQNLNSIVTLVAIMLIIEIGAASMLVGIYAKNDPSGISEWFGEAGRTIIVTGLIAFIYEYLVKKGVYRELSVNTKDIHNELLQETKDKIANINEDYKKLNEDTQYTCRNICSQYDNVLGETKENIYNLNSDLKQVYQIGSNFKKHLEETERTMIFSRSVIDSGLVKIHPSRRSALKSFNYEVNQNKDQTEVNVYLCGITLKDFFDEAGDYYDHFKSWLQNIQKLKVYVIMLENNSKTANERARRENPLTYSRKGYTDTRLCGELKNTEGNIENLLRSYPDKISMKKSNACPLCFLAVINDTMIMEPYNYAVRGGITPAFEIKRSINDIKTDPYNKDVKSPDLYDIYMQHFISLWIKPCQGDDSKMMEELSHFIEMKPKSYEEYLVDKGQNI